MSTVLTVLAYWFALSIPATATICFLIKRRIIQFHPIEQRTELDDLWGPQP